MFAFLKATAWHYQAFLRAENGDVWRVWFENGQPMMQRLIGDEAEYQEPFSEIKLEQH